MTRAELDRRLAALVARADDMAEAFMRLDLEIRMLARAAAAAEPPPPPGAPKGDPLVDDFSQARLAAIRRSR